MTKHDDLLEAVKVLSDLDYPSVESILIKYKFIYEATIVKGVVDAYMAYINSDKKPLDRVPFIDDDGYISFYDCSDMEGPGVMWTLHFNGWEAYVNSPDEIKPLAQVGGQEFPSDDELANCAKVYEEWLKENK